MLPGHVPDLTQAPSVVSPSSQKLLLKKREDEHQKWQEYQAALQDRKKIVDQQKQQEYQAASYIRKAIDRLKSAQPEDIDLLRGEFELAMTEQYIKLGSMSEKIQQEADTALNAALTRCEEMQGQQDEEYNKQMEEEAILLDHQEQADKMTVEAEQLLIDAETKVLFAEESATQMDAAAAEGFDELILKGAQATEELINAAKLSLNEAYTSLNMSWDDLGFKPAILSKMRQEFRQMLLKTTECRKKLMRIGVLARTAKAKAQDKESKAKAEETKRTQQQAAFDKYDKDCNGRLSREDVVAFAKAEYYFDLEGESLEKVFSKVSPKGQGVIFESFPKLRLEVAMARSAAKERERRAKAAPQVKAEVVPEAPGEEDEGAKRKREGEPDESASKKSRALDESEG